jgi:2-polyprenyl-6-hydroxyphenyl methylase/3-demethylubiquinone-9 3-methyltransferase
VRRRFKIAPRSEGALQTVRDAGRRTLPPRYATDLWDLRFRERLDALLGPGIAILDVGAGRRPTLAPADRPEGTSYVGLDLDAEELAEAAPGSYDETVAAPAEERVESLEGRFDLVLSFFAFEHVTSTAAVLDNIRFYLKPGGGVLAQLAGANSPFSLANRLLPGRLSKTVLSKTQSREPDSVFPARYDSCSHSELSALLDGVWSEAEVLPLYTGAGYVLFSRLLTAGYVAYEEWAYRRDRRDLAPYYLLAARK